MFFFVFGFIDEISFWTVMGRIKRFKRKIYWEFQFFIRGISVRREEVEFLKLFAQRSRKFSVAKCSLIMSNRSVVIAN